MKNQIIPVWIEMRLIFLKKKKSRLEQILQNKQKHVVCEVVFLFFAFLVAIVSYTVGESAQIHLFVPRQNTIQSHLWTRCAQYFRLANVSQL